MTGPMKGTGLFRRGGAPRRLAAGLAALALVGTTGCGPDQVDPGIDPGTPGPLTAQEAELLVEGPFSELLDSLSQVAGDDAHTEMTSGGIERDGGACVWSSPTHAWTADMSIQTWDELADKVRPSVKAWGMDDEFLDRPERSAGAGLVAENPHNGAQLEVRGWNPPPDGDEPPAEPGTQDGFSVQVTVPLDDAECA